MSVRILQGDCRDVLRSLPEASVHCVVTSPPYYNLRDYQITGQIGLEASPDEYVAALVAVFQEVRRVLRDDGTLWLNLGSSFCSKQIDSPQYGTIKPKDDLGIPWMVAFALRTDGWYLRSEIIWHKPNPMPESVTDRPTSAHESIFLLSKNRKYFYDADAVRETSASSTVERAEKGYSHGGGAGTLTSYRGDRTFEANGRNLRNVWTVATQPFSEAHFATFPPDLIEPCIKAGTSEKGCCAKCGAPWVRDVEKGAPDLAHQRACGGDANGAYSGTSTKDYASAGAQDASATKARILAGMREKTTTGWSRGCLCAGFENPAPCTVLDPFGGAGTTGLVADRLGRNAVLIELNPEYADMAKHRLTIDAGFFNTGVEVA